MGDNPYRSSVAPTLAAPVSSSQPARRTVVVMAGTGVLLGITQLALALWAWRVGIITQPHKALMVLGSVALYFALGYGVYRHSRICACVLLVYAELHALLALWAFSPMPAYALLVPLALLLVMVNGTLAVFRSHARH